MMRIDDVLAAQFRIKKQMAQLKYDADVRFKVCVLELFELYIKVQRMYDDIACLTRNTEPVQERAGV